MDSRPIGVFDSGLGGLTALMELRRLMPNESYIYFGDCGRAPYGGRSHDELKAFTNDSINILSEYNVKAMLAACGTTSSVALPFLPEQVVPLFGVIDPVSVICSQTKLKRLGIIATEASINMGAYEKKLRELSPYTELIPIACPLFVPLVEKGKLTEDDPDVMEAVREHLAPLKEAEIDALLLGCTHYPLMKDAISAFMGKSIKLFGAGEAAAQELSQYLLNKSLCAAQKTAGSCRYITSGDGKSFRNLAELLTGWEINDDIIEIAL